MGLTVPKTQQFLKGLACLAICGILPSWQQEGVTAMKNALDLLLDMGILFGLGAAFNGPAVWMLISAN
jgi:hypothetical protein